MSARIIKNDRDRMVTLFIIGFMSCGARLPVYVLFVGAFFAPAIQGDVMFAIYMGGAFLGLVFAKILRVSYLILYPDGGKKNINLLLSDNKNKQDYVLDMLQNINKNDKNELLNLCTSLI